MASKASQSTSNKSWVIERSKKYKIQQIKDDVHMNKPEVEKYESTGATCALNKVKSRHKI